MYIDSHCHLDFSVFDKDRGDILKKCHHHDVRHFIVPGTRFKGWEKQSILSQEYSSLSMAYGIHPYFLNGEEFRSIDLLGGFCESNFTVAIGEIGLDIWPNSLPIDIQLAFFRAQLSIAKSLKLPVILHARRSYDILYKELKNSHFLYGGSVHGFSGSWVQAQRFIELGFVLGIGGNITYTRAKKSIKVIKELNSVDYVLETDSPDMPVFGKQGERNTPLNIPIVAQSISEIRQESIKDIAYQTSINVGRVFPSIVKGF